MAPTPNIFNQNHDDVINTCQEGGLTKGYVELLKNKIEKEKNLSLRLFKITAYTEDHHEHGDYQQFYIIGDSIDTSCEKIKNHIGNNFIAITNIEIKGTENKPENCPGYGLILN